MNPLHRKHLPTDPKSNPQLFPARWLNVTVKPGEEIVLPSFLIAACRPSSARTPLPPAPADCIDVGESHTKRIVGGLGPQLTRVSPQSARASATFARARSRHASGRTESLDDRLAERARRGVQ